MNDDDHAKALQGAPAARGRRDAVQCAFDRFGQAHGFERRSGNLYLRSPEVVTVTNLQRSQYGPQYYVNQGFWLTSVAGEHYPKEQQCHVRVRLDTLLREAAREVRALLDLSDGQSDRATSDELLSLLTDLLLPLLERGRSIAGLRALHDEGRFVGAALRAEALDLLDGRG